MESTFQRPGPLKLDASNLEEWKFFIRKYNLFVLASGYANKTEQVRLAMLWNFVGDDALKMYDTFCNVNEGDDKKLEVVVKKIEGYCTPKENVVHERFLFWKSIQQLDDSIDNFITALRLKAAYCEFGNQTDSMIL